MGTDLITLRLKLGFPRVLGEDVETVCQRLEPDPKICSPYLNYNDEVNLEGEQLKIPYRVYFTELALGALNEVQKVILCCILTRHNDGFVRQRYLRKLLSCDEQWVVPYFFQLLGEYVGLILCDIEGHVHEYPDNYIRFIEQNPVFYRQTNDRMISYWECYYREDYPKYRKNFPNRTDRPNQKDYVGYRIFGYLGQLLKVRGVAVPKNIRLRR